MGGKTSKDSAQKWREKNRAKCVAATRSWEQRNPEKARAKNRRYDAKKRKANKDAAFAAYGGYLCACCGESEPCFMTIDHVDGGGSQHRKTLGSRGSAIYGWLVKNGFPPGFQVLCLNCNRGRWMNGGICPHQTKCQSA